MLSSKTSNSFPSNRVCSLGCIFARVIPCMLRPLNIIDMEQSHRASILSQSTMTEPSPAKGLHHSTSISKPEWKVALHDTQAHHLLSTAACLSSTQPCTTDLFTSAKGTTSRCAIFASLVRDYPGVSAITVGILYICHYMASTKFALGCYCTLIHRIRFESLIAITELGDDILYPVDPSLMQRYASLQRYAR
jgi:hypothetical protein